MFDFSKLNVSELRAISGDLGLKQNKSATQPELAAKVADFFKAKDAADVMASLDRPKIQKVARRLSVNPRTGTNREIAQRTVDAVLAGNVTFNDPELKPKPKSADPKSTDPKPGEKDPNKETRKWLGLPWWAWVLIVAGIVLFDVLAFRPRPISTVDLSPLQESIGQVSTKVDALDQNISDLSGRVDALEQAPAAPKSETAKASSIEGPVVEEFDIVEISTGSDPLVGVNDSNAVPTATLEPGYGAMLSSDSGSFEVGGISTPSDTGYMAYVYNDSEEPVELKAYTGFNEDNDRYSVSAVLFEVNTLKGLREKTLLQNCSENKPAVFGKIWDGSTLVDDNLGNLNRMCDAVVTIGRSEQQDTWVEYPELVELGTDITLPEIGINDPDKNPSVTLKPGQGLWVSSDPGSYKINDGDSAPVVNGYTLWVFNDSANKDLAVEISTGFNESQVPPRYNASFVVFSEATSVSLAEYAHQKNIDEVKPQNFAFVWDGQQLISQD